MKSLISVTRISRALNIPESEIEENLKNPTQEFRALIMFLEMFPWMLDVAEQGFDPKYSKLTEQIEFLKKLRDGE